MIKTTIKIALLLCSLAMMSFAWKAVAENSPAPPAAAPVGTSAAVPAHAAPIRATKEEALAFVKKAIDYIKTAGPEKAFAEINDPKGQFIDRDMFVVAYDSTGLCLAHGYNPKLAGRNRIDETDGDEKPYVRERLELMKTQTSFWRDYRLPDKYTHKLVWKAVYCEVVPKVTPLDIMVCSGAYDPKH